LSSGAEIFGVFGGKALHTPGCRQPNQEAAACHSLAAPSLMLFLSMSVTIYSFKALAMGFSGARWRITTLVLSLHVLSLHWEVAVLLEERFIPLWLQT